MEKELTKKASCDFQKLIAYGFKKQGEYYVYHTIMMNTFQVDIYVDEQGELSGKIYDMESGEEYVNHRIKQQSGEFVSKVREAYFEILYDIVRACYDKQPFIGKQANEIAAYLKETYGTTPEFLWKKYPGHGVFRNDHNQKWYGIIMNIPASKIMDKEGDIEILDVMIEPEQLDEILNETGYYPAYHMNKKKWITIVLNESVCDEELKQRLNQSYQISNRKK